MKNWREAIVTATTPLRETIAHIDAAGSQLGLVVDEAGRLIGVLTDGDIRRALLKLQDMSIETGQIMNRNARTAHISTAEDELLKQMRTSSIHQIPLLDDENRVVGLSTLDALVGVRKQPNSVVLMVGGLGRRLRPLTESRPKPMIMVGAQPLLQTILESFLEKGFRKFFFAVNYKASIIRDYFGDGERWDAKIEYLQERKRLGTAGALSLLPFIPDEPLVVMNGDVLTRASIEEMLRFHHSSSASATMAVREYDSEVPYGVVQIDGHRITQIDEKPVQRHFVNAGIYILSPSALYHVPKNTYFDMPSLFNKLMECGEETAAFPVREYWLDIGRMEELERAQKEWNDG